MKKPIKLSSIYSSDKEYTILQVLKEFLDAVENTGYAGTQLYTHKVNFKLSEQDSTFLLIVSTKQDQYGNFNNIWRTGTIISNRVAGTQIVTALYSNETLPSETRKFYIEYKDRTGTEQSVEVTEDDFISEVVKAL